VSLTLDHQQKTLSEDRQERDVATCRNCFVQAFEQVHAVRPSSLRLAGDGTRAFNVSYVNENGIDAGGVYREAVTEIVEDLHTQDFDLFILCPNGVHKINSNMDKYVPNCKNKSPLAIQMFEFVGKLMGLSLRTKATLPFHFPAFVWKGVVGTAITREDLEGVDAMTVQFLETLEGVSASHGMAQADEDVSMSAEEFDAAYAGVAFFSVSGSDGKDVELIPGGKQIPVTWSNRRDYCRMAERYRLHEIDLQLAAMRRGLACMVPLRILQLFTWQQVEELVAGKTEIDVAYLRANTELRGFTHDDKVVQYFWSALESFTDDERSQFIRFVWGRSRLPLRGRKWPQRFKLQRSGRGDGRLPVTHTCFFSIEMPEYSSAKVMRDRLLTAIHFGVGGILNG
jgi:hypothetical protein